MTTQPGIHVEVVTDAHLSAPVDDRRIHAAVITAAQDQGFRQGEIAVRLTDDETIHQINLDHLGHDYPTDVISFDYGSDGSTHLGDRAIQGEMVVSVDTAASRATELAWPLEHELLLYIVHGTLHIAGLDDHSDADRRQMRAAERRVMRQLGIEQIAALEPATDDAVSTDHASSEGHPEDYEGHPEDYSEDCSGEEHG